eukprot:3740807-Rhodomonas_salina.1
MLLHDVAHELGVARAEADHSATAHKIEEFDDYLQEKINEKLCVYHQNETGPRECTGINTTYPAGLHHVNMLHHMVDLHERAGMREIEESNGKYHRN